MSKKTMKDITDYQKFIHTSRYARWVDGEGRRETLEETIDRYMERVFTKSSGLGDNTDTYQKVKDAIMSFSVMPSMRALMTAGAAADRGAGAGQRIARVRDYLCRRADQRRTGHRLRPYRVRLGVLRTRDGRRAGDRAGLP